MKQNAKNINNTKLFLYSHTDFNFIEIFGHAFGALY